LLTALSESLFSEVFDIKPTKGVPGIRLRAPCFFAVSAIKTFQISQKLGFSVQLSPETEFRKAVCIPKLEFGNEPEIS
jgi:hypothetical protein